MTVPPLPTRPIKSLPTTESSISACTRDLLAKERTPGRRHLTYQPTVNFSMSRRDRNAYNPGDCLSRSELGIATVWRLKRTSRFRPIYHDGVALDWGRSPSGHEH